MQAQPLLVQRAGSFRMPCAREYQLTLMGRPSLRRPCRGLATSGPGPGAALDLREDAEQPPGREAGADGHCRVQEVPPSRPHRQRPVDPTRGDQPHSADRVDRLYGQTQRTSPVAERAAQPDDGKLGHGSATPFG